MEHNQTKSPQKVVKFLRGVDTIRVCDDNYNSVLEMSLGQADQRSGNSIILPQNLRKENSKRYFTPIILRAE